LVLGLLLTSAVHAQNTGWWKFDEGSGTTAYDSSGNNRNAEILGSPEWVAGVPGFGGALDFTNTRGANAGDFDPTGGMGAFTIAFWCRWDGTGGIQHFLTKSNGWNLDTMMFQVEVKGGHSNPDRVNRFHLACQGHPQAVLHVVPANEWAHMAMVFDGTNATGYLNGVDETGPQPTGIGAPLACPVWIGVAFNDARVFQGMIDDMQVYDRVLGQDEIIDIMAGVGEEKLSAYGPEPADGSLHLNTWVNLGWKAGPKAVSHDVYIGDNFDDVNDGTPEMPVFVGNQTDVTSGASTRLTTPIRTARGKGISGVSRFHRRLPTPPTRLTAPSSWTLMWNLPGPEATVPSCIQSMSARASRKQTALPEARRWGRRTLTPELSRARRLSTGGSMNSMASIPTRARSGVSQRPVPWAIHNRQMAPWTCR
jgi:hypothetical protein